MAVAAAAGMPQHESRALKALDGLLADVAAGSVDKKLSRYERMKRKVAEEGGPKVLVDFEFARPIPPQPYLCQFVHQWPKLSVTHELSIRCTEVVNFVHRGLKHSCTEVVNFETSYPL